MIASFEDESKPHDYSFVSDTKNKVIEGLLEMVSQSLTYLLQSEENNRKQAAEIDSLNNKVLFLM